MKLKIVLTIAALLGCSSLASATAISYTTGTSLGSSAPTAFKPSSKVFMDAISDGTHYGATTQHQSAKGNSAKGGWQYGTTDSEASIKRKASTANDAPDNATQPAVPSGFDAF